MNEARTWSFPPEPADVERVRDCREITWTRDTEGSWEASGYDSRSWARLLAARGPLTEVVTL